MRDLKLWKKLPDNFPAPRSLWDAVREMTTFTREALGEERIAWLGALPRVVIHPPVALVHASPPASAWRSPLADATDAELESTYLAPLSGDRRLRPHSQAVCAEPGRVSSDQHREYQPVLGRRSPRSRTCSLITAHQQSGGSNTISNEKSMRITTNGLPHADWMARTLRAACPPHALI